MDDEWSYLCSHPDTEKKVLSRLENSDLCSDMKQVVSREIVKPSVSVEGLEDTIYNIVTSTKLHTRLRNAVYKELFNIHIEGVNVAIPAEIRKEPVEYISSAQQNWEKKLKQVVEKIYISKNVTLFKERRKPDKELLKKKWDSIGANYPGEFTSFPSMYHPKDFLNMMTQIRDPDYILSPFPEPEGAESDPAGGILETSVNVVSLFKLREMFSGLHPSKIQVESCSSDYLEKAKRVIKDNLWSLSRELCKTGCPVGHRREMWCRTLALDTSKPEHAVHYEELKCAVLQYFVTFEKMIINDVKRTAANDDNYFVFEDIMHQVLLCFLHDSSLLQHFEHLCPTPMMVQVQCQHHQDQAQSQEHSEEGQPHQAQAQDQSQPEETVYPPNGVVPFHGFSLFIAPICFLMDAPHHLYALFKEMYLRFFVHLHCLSSHPQGILSLSCQFENLLQCREPELFKHLKNIKASPLRLAFPWLMSAFSGFLDTREVLLLWDRVIGYNSLTIIAVMAVAIFEFRATNLFKVTDSTEAKEVLSDLHYVRVLPLLQQTLFL